jgi:hypothetical protein
MIRLTLAVATLFAVATPALAQDDGPVETGSERVNQVIVYGDDPCPASSGDEITVCARKEETERYRIPEILRQSDDPANVAWSERVTAYETVGKFGTMSCSPSGIGGWTGCTQLLIDAAYAEKDGSSDIRFSELIEEERAKRLSTIDEEAAAQQARVEMLEKEYEARLEAEREAALPNETPSLVLPPANESEN